MTREDVAKLIRMNFVLYKLGSKPLTDKEMQTTIDVWAYQFGDYDGDTVKRAFLAANTDRVLTRLLKAQDLDGLRALLALDVLDKAGFASAAALAAKAENAAAAALLADAEHKKYAPQPQKQRYDFDF